MEDVCGSTYKYILIFILFIFFISLFYINFLFYFDFNLG